MRHLCGLFAVVLTANVGVVVARADSVPPAQAAWFTTFGSAGHSGNSLFSLGWSFDLSDPYVVTHLGYYDYQGDGLTDTHDVGIFTSTGTLLVSATVTTADLLQNSFRWVESLHVTLPAGHYVIAATSGATDAYQIQGGTAVFDPRVTWTKDLYDFSATLILPTSSVGPRPYSYFGPNFGTVPEPGTVVMVGSGMALLLLRRARTKKI